VSIQSGQKTGELFDNGVAEQTMVMISSTTVMIHENPQH
jgi:hypothetical protein